MERENRRQPGSAGRTCCGPMSMNAPLAEAAIKGHRPSARTAGDGVPVDDILETVHHFRTIDYVIDCAHDVLTEEIVKRLHEMLKRDTKDASLDWFAVGDYKRRPNVAGGHETTKPEDVPFRMKALLDGYNAKSEVTIQDVIAFHAEFEKIHPFQDGNGRVGRLIVLKECLRHSIVLFLIY